MLSWNPLTARSSLRLHEITRICKQYDIIILNGTHIRQDNTPIRTQRILTHTFLHWGYSKGQMTNKSAGVSIGVRNKWYPYIYHISSPDDSIGGRAGGIRIKNGLLDCFFGGFYLPPHTGHNRPNVIAKAVLRWIDKTSSALPYRCTPF